MKPTKPKSLSVFLCTLFTMSLSWMGSSAWAVSSAPRNTPHRVATWNLQNGPSFKWPQIDTMSSDQYVLALQEASTDQPAGSQVTTDRNDLPAGVTEYHWAERRGSPERYVYTLQEPSRNLAMVTAYRSPAVYVIDSVYRNALATVDPVSGVLFVSIHAASGGGNDVGALLRRIDAFAQTSGHTFWCAMGDFNRQPEDLNNMLPPGTQYFRSGQATHLSGRELDYMVSNFDPGDEHWSATVGASRDSDHWPVFFSPLRAAGERSTPVVIQSRSTGNVLDVQADNHQPLTPIIGHRPTGAPNQTWVLDELASQAGEPTPSYQIYSPDTQLCLDFERRVVSPDPNVPGVQFHHAPTITKLCDVPPFSGGRTDQPQQHFKLIRTPGPDHNAFYLVNEWGDFLTADPKGSGALPTGLSDPDDNGFYQIPAVLGSLAQIFFLHPLLKKYKY